MVLYYKLNNNYIKFKCSDFYDGDNYNKSKLAKAIKNSLMKKYKISIDEYILNNTNIKNIEKCAFCDEYSYYNIIFNISVYNNTYLIEIKNIDYDNRFYCKSKNKNCIGKTYNPNSVIFVSKTRKISEDDALKVIHNRNKSPFYLNNYESYDDYKNYQSLQSRLDTKKYNNYIKNLKYSKTIDYYIEKYGKDEGENIWNEINKKKDSMSLNYFLNKNDNDHKKALIEYNSRVKSVMPSDKCRVGGFYSNSSYIFFDKVKDIINANVGDIVYGDNEFFIEYYDKKIEKKRKFYYDFVDLKNKIIIEYNGLRWHPNKNKMTLEQYDNWYHPFCRETKKEDIEKKDNYKRKVAIDNNYKYIIVWDCDDMDFNYNKIYKYYKKNKLI